MSLEKLSGAKSENITATSDMSLSELHIPPAVVLAHERIRRGFLAGDPPDTIIICNDLGYIPLPDGVITFRRK